LCAVQLRNNTALVDGGALILDGMTGTSLLYGNTASGNQAIGGRGGFALLGQTMSSCSNCFLRVVSSNFTSNTAGECGVAGTASVRFDVPLRPDLNRLVV
jgi:hypothetical protein